MDDLIIKSKQQDDIIKKLDVFINSGKIPHLLFYGTDGTGKRTLLQYLIDKIYKDITNKNEYIILFNQGGGAIDEKITNILSITNSDMVDVNKIFKHANGLSINLSSDHSNLIQKLAEVKSIELDRELKYTPPIKYLPADSPIDTFFKDNIYLENKSDQGDFSTKNISGIKTYADNFKKELNISDSYKSSSISINSLTAYNNTYASTGEILPYGVRAVWEGNDISEKGNIGIGSYAFVIDSGVLNTTNDLNVNTAWSKSFVEGEGAFEDGAGHGTHVSGTIAALASRQSDRCFFQR